MSCVYHVYRVSSMAKKNTNCPFSNIYPFSDNSAATVCLLVLGLLESPKDLHTNTYWLKYCRNKNIFRDLLQAI